jgi:hypothetical protein
MSANNLNKRFVTAMAQSDTTATIRDKPAANTNSLLHSPEVPIYAAQEYFDSCPAR